MKAVFDPRYVKRLHGTHLKEGKTKWDLAQQLVDEIQQFQKEKDLDRMVMIWCGSTEVFIDRKEVHQSVEKLEAGLKNNDENIPSSMIYAYAARAHLGKRLAPSPRWARSAWANEPKRGFPRLPILFPWRA